MLVYTAKGRHHTKMEVEISPDAIASSVRVKVTKEENGNPAYPKSYQPLEVIEISMDREEFRTMIRCLDSVI